MRFRELRLICILTLCFSKALSPLDKTAIINEYLNNAAKPANIAAALKYSLSRIPNQIPSSAKEKLAKMNRTIFDFDAFHKALINSQVPPEIIQAMVTANKQLDTKLRQRLNQAVTKYYENCIVWHQEKQVSDFSAFRIATFTQEYFDSNGPDRQKKMEKELSPIMGRIMWRIFSPGKPENTKEIDAKIKAINEKSSAEIDKYAIKREMMPSLLLPSLLRTMLLSDLEFRQFRDYANSPSVRAVEDFLFTFQHNFTTNQLTLFIKTL